MARIERHWYGITPLHLVLLPASLLFGLIAAVRRLLYRTGILKSQRLPVPVIVVGNITVGGSGKTPLALWLVQQLLDAGWHPGVVSRGYGGTATAPRAVSPLDSAAEVGDEPLLMAQRELCPVWIGRDRPAAARALLNAHPACDVIISDDGMQHYPLARDVEIAVIDGHRGFGNGFLLPAGPLREPVSRLDTVDAVVVNGGADNAIRTGTRQFGMQLRGETLHNLLNPEVTAPIAAFRALRLHAVAGIGHPERFFKYLETLGLAVVRHPLPDHHRYSPADIAIPDADAILMTEKDAVKCAPFATEKCWVLRVNAQIDPALVQHILGKIQHHGRQTA